MPFLYFINVDDNICKFGVACDLKKHLDILYSYHHFKHIIDVYEIFYNNRLHTNFPVVANRVIKKLVKEHQYSLKTKLIYKNSEMFVYEDYNKYIKALETFLKNTEEKLKNEGYKFNYNIMDYDGIVSYVGTSYDIQKFNGK